ncbi:MAG: complex I NDUFA9 subunit family protein, partial [Alphaproteobacteria bacterium]
MASKTVTIFGGSGFLGRHLVKRLAGDDWTIRVAVRHPHRAAFLKPMGDVAQIVPIASDVKDEESVAAAVAGSEAAVNLVGILYQRGRQTFEAVHAEGARRVAEAAREAGAKRLVHVSALGADSGSPSLYARSKAAGEAAVSEAFEHATIVRPSVVFGPEDAFFNRFAALARLLPVLPLFGGGTVRLQPVYVGDVADGLARILTDPAAAGKT